ncbi:hypothetical protein DRN69_00850 [Candidatus Pacearchaeota archaeon]|nr:MAG: hypothetical protein DRN69_00850 [Candidatus Pacearchaeota archaeon]
MQKKEMKNKKEKKQSKEEKKEKLLKELDHLNFRKPRTFGQKAADALTKWAGSWAFIISFLIFLAVWMTINGYFLIKYEKGAPFDPYPFILLNLLLSCLAAIQAPIILMSQNRQAQRDRLKAEYDYMINKKAEQEIREIKNLLIRQNRKKEKNNKTKLKLF